MQLPISQHSFFVFDLDDTLFQELDYLKSAYRHIASKLSAKIGCDLYEEMFTRYYRKENVFLWIISQYGKYMRDIDVNWLLREYREHVPVIQLSDETTSLLQALKSMSVPMGLITDGRSVTQRNKLIALGIEDNFTHIIISEEFGSTKPDPRNYTFFENKYPGKEFFYIGDNPAKDFIVPLQLGWKTICLRNKGNNIHSQDFEKHGHPHFVIDSFSEIELVSSEAIAYA